jgi:hypothetical protein
MASYPKGAEVEALAEGVAPKGMALETVEMGEPVWDDDGRETGLVYLCHFVNVMADYAGCVEVFVPHGGGDMQGEWHEFTCEDF